MYVADPPYLRRGITQVDWVGIGLLTLGLTGLQVVLGSMESRPSPEPDILCELADRGRIAFELVNLADEDLMRTIAHAIRGETGGVWFGDPRL